MASRLERQKKQKQKRKTNMAAISLLVEWWVLVTRFCSSNNNSYFSLLLWSMYTQIYSGRKLQSGSFSLCSLSVSPRGMLSTEKKKSSRFKVLCCEISREYSFILYIWCEHLSHLLGLSHLQVLSLSSSWRSLQNSSVCLQEHRQVAGSCTNKRFLLSVQ